MSLRYNFMTPKYSIDGSVLISTAVWILTDGNSFWSTGSLPQSGIKFSKHAWNHLSLPGFVLYLLTDQATIMQVYSYKYILLNNNSAYCAILRSSKGFDTSKIGSPKWPCIL